LDDLADAVAHRLKLLSIEEQQAVPAWWDFPRMVSSGLCQEIRCQYHILLVAAKEEKKSKSPDCSGLSLIALHANALRGLASPCHAFAGLAE
jgi:hypothetical protein